MQKTISKHYQKVKDSKNEKEFNDEIKDLQKKYDYLIDDEASAMLLVDMLGKNDKCISKIIDLHPGMDSTVIGNITSVYQSKTFKRKNGRTGRVANLDLSDSSGTCTLVLWNKDVELLKNNQIQVGSRIKVINGYVKNGYNGTEINLGRWGLIEIIDQKKDLTKSKRKTNEITGKIVEILPTRAFFKDNGDFGFVAKMKVQQENNISELTVWDNKVKEIQKIKINDKIVISNISLRGKKGKKEIHVNGNSKIKKV